MLIGSPKIIGRDESNTNSSQNRLKNLKALKSGPKGYWIIYQNAQTTASNPYGKIIYPQSTNYKQMKSIE